MTELSTPGQALRIVLEHARPLSTENVSLDDAAGRVLSEDARATVDLPPFASSAMDGFAVRAGDTPGRLRIAGRAAAGTPAGRALGPDEAIGIATGAAVPAGADAVVPIEHVTQDEDTVEVPVVVPVGENVRPRAGDIAAGDVVVSAGTRIGAPQTGALAAAGVAAVACAARPRVTILTTGSELRTPGDRLQHGEIYESNGRMLAVALGERGAIVTRLPVVADTTAAHRAAFAAALDSSDVVVSSGGVSVGPHDLVRAVTAELGVEERFWGVAMRPGKPLWFGTRATTLVFGLPGNPVSALVGATLFVAPALLALQGATAPEPVWQIGAVSEPVRRNAHRDDFVRARAAVTDAGVTLTPVTGQESHMIARTASADTLIHVPRGEGQLAAGDSARYLLLS